MYLETRTYNPNLFFTKTRTGKLNLGKKVVQLFNSVDPLSDKYPGISPYAYAANNPMKYVDPDGRAFQLPFILWKATATALELFGTNSNVRTAGYAMNHPINATRVGAYRNGSNNISTIASNFEINIANATGLSRGEDGTAGNAIRHSIWQAMTTENIRSDHATRIGNAHEDNLNIDLSQRKFGKMGDADKAADLLNNMIGREIGEKNKGASNKTMAGKVMKEYHEKGLWTVSGSEETGFDLQRTKINKEQYNSAIREINRKGENGLDQ